MVDGKVAAQAATVQADHLSHQVGCNGPVLRLRCGLAGDGFAYDDGVGFRASGELQQFRPEHPR